MPNYMLYAVAYRGGLEGGFQGAPPKFRSFDKAEPNFLFRGNYIRNTLITNTGFTRF
jgi:hypothetical protein